MKQIDSIRLLQNIAIAANEATSVEEALQICLDEICALIKWPVGHVYLHSNDALDEMVSSRIWHLDDPEEFTSFKKVTEITSFTIGEGLPGRVYASGEPAWIPDVTQDRNFPRAELAKNIEVKSGFAFPVKVDGKVAAVLEFYSPKAVSPDKDVIDITTQISIQLSHVIKRKRAENEMQKNAEIINQIQDAVITTDLDGVIRSWNKGAEVQLGYTAAETIGKSIHLVYSQPESKVMHSATIDKLIEKGRIGFESEMRKKSGTIFPVYLSQSLSKDAMGTITGIINYSSDITQQKQADAILKRAKVIDQIHDAVISTDQEGYITLWNKGAERLFGYSATEIIDKTIYQLYPKVKESIAPGKIFDIINKQGSLELESLMRKKSGEEIYVHNALSILTDEEGNISGIISYIIDISASKKAEEELRKYEQIVSASTDLVAIINEDYTVAACNAQFLKYRNRKRDEVIGKHVSFASEAGYFESIQKELLDKCLAGESIRVQHWRNYEGVGTRFVDLQYSPFSDSKGDKKVLATTRDITERKQAEKELQLLHQRLDLHLENSPLGLLEMDKDFRVLRWSKQAEKIFGWKEDEIINKSLQEIGLVYDEDVSTVDNKLNDLAEGKIQNLISLNRNYTKDGRVIDVEWYNSAVVDEHGELVSVLALAHDITERNKAEKELQLFGRMLSASKDAVVLINKKYIIEACNPQYCNMRGLTPDDVLGQHIDKINKEVYFKHGMKDILNRCLAGETIQQQQWVKYPTLDKETYVDMQFVPYKDEDSDEPKILAMGRDITELKQAEEELHQFGRMLSASKDPMVLINKKYIVEACNPQYCNMRGLSPDDIVGQHVDNIDEEDYFKNILKDILDRCLAGETIRKQHWRKYPTLDKDIYVDMQFIPYKDEDSDEPRILAIGHDITELKQAEEQLEKYRTHLEELVKERTSELELAQKQLVQKERLAVLGQLTATVSHELRNPLGTIRSSLHVINAKVANQDLNLENILNRADRSIERCVSIIEQLLCYVPTSHNRIQTMILTNIDQWITEILDEYKFPEGIKVKRIMDAGVSIKCEKEDIRRCIINVIDNACQAMTGDDNSYKQNKDNQLMVKTNTSDSKFIIEISDTGIGIPKDVIDKIFEPLFSTKIYGVGLGLPIIMQIMEQHHGNVEITSAENEGTQVILWLPINADQEETTH